ncbi:MAG: hypothetical protein OQL16_08275 [Gammaproteobacteria bacterium]|nr:hypothetical protein [Gammaproteobacteria bacterium]
MDTPMMVYAGFLGSALLLFSVVIYMIIKRSPKKPDEQESRKE